MAGNKFLVIQQKMIGDVLNSTLICEHLKIHFPDATVHYVINEHTLPVVEGNPHIDKIILFKKEYKRSKIKFYKFLKDFKQEEYAAVIDVYCKTESNLISYFAKSKTKISYEKWYSKFIYTDLFRYSNSTNSELGLAVENRLLLLSPLIQNLKKKNLAPKIFLKEKELSQAKELLFKSNLDLSKPLLMVGLMGSSNSKTYPLAYLAELINEITKATSINILLNYTPEQKPKVKEFLNYCSEKSKSCIHEEVFCNSLRSFLALLKQCDGYLGNEGGASNMSKALDVPNFAIFSPWISKEAWFTYHQNPKNWAVHLKDFKPSLIQDKSKKERKENVEYLYQEFIPSLFNEQVISYIETQIL